MISREIEDCMRLPKSGLYLVQSLADPDIADPKASIIAFELVFGFGVGADQSISKIPEFIAYPAGAST